MAPRELTGAQLSSKLAYQAHTPNFLVKFKNRMNGIPDDEEDEDDNDDEFEHVGGGREPIPRRPRPPIPERPDDNPGSEGEDRDDEKPQVVVLKTGKHLTEREAENIRRAEKGLPPLPDADASLVTAAKPIDDKTSEPSSSKTKTDASSSKGLSFSSSSSAKFKSNKRKATELDELKRPDSERGKKEEKGSKTSAKKAKKEKKTLLSFGDDT